MKRLLLFVVSSVVITSSYAQRTRQERVDSLEKVRMDRLYGEQNRWKRLNALYNDPFVYPTVSAVLLPLGFVEINNASSLLTTNRLFTDQARLEDLNARTTNFSNLLQLTYGVSSTSRLNIGVDLLYSAFRLDLDSKSSPLSVFGADSALSRDGGLSTVGIRFRLRPRPQNRSLVLQGGVYLPVRQVASSQTSARLQAIYVFELSKTMFLYAQGGVVYSFPKQLLADVVSMPVAAIFQYQLQPTFGVLGVLGNNLTITMPGNGMTGQTAFGTQIGGGVQYQPSLRFGLTSFYTRYVFGRNTGAYDTVNLAVRVII